MAAAPAEAKPSLESRMSKDEAPAASEQSGQKDGATPPSDTKEPNLVDTEFEVEVKLADMQADPNNPLFSAKSFEELQL